MRARARVEARVDRSGITRLVTLRSEVPLVLRPAADGTLWLAAGAAGPLVGDDLGLDIVIGAGARLVVRSVAASIAQPGSGTAPSRFAVTADVEDGGQLEWLPEPLVLARGCDHEVGTDLMLGEAASVLWREELVLGRHGEDPGALRSRLRVDRGRLPLFRQEIALGPGHPAWNGPAVVGRARAVGSLLSIPPSPSNREDAPVPPPGPSSQVARSEVARSEVAVLAGGVGVLVSALGSSPAALRAALDRSRRAGPATPRP